MLGGGVVDGGCRGADIPGERGCCEGGVSERGSCCAKRALFSRIQLIARASFWKRLRDTSAKVRMSSGLEPAEEAVLWLIVASGWDRKTAPPFVQATAYTIFRPRPFMRTI